MTTMRDGMARLTSCSIQGSRDYQHPPFKMVKATESVNVLTDHFQTFSEKNAIRDRREKTVTVNDPVS